MAPYGVAIAPWCRETRGSSAKAGAMMAASDAMRRFRELHDQLKAQLSDLSQAEQEGNGKAGTETRMKGGAGRGM